MALELLESFDAFEKAAKRAFRKRSERSDWSWEQLAAEVLGLDVDDPRVVRIGGRIRHSEGPYVPSNYRQKDRVDRVLVTFYQETKTALRSPAED
jgi:hypothetical protein